VSILRVASATGELEMGIVIAHTKPGKRDMFLECYGSSSIGWQIAHGMGAAGNITSWQGDVARFKGERSQYLLY
jgi:hypothetical protein